MLASACCCLSADDMALLTIHCNVGLVRAFATGEYTKTNTLAENVECLACEVGKYQTLQNKYHVTECTPQPKCGAGQKLSSLEVTSLHVCIQCATNHYMVRHPLSIPCTCPFACRMPCSFLGTRPADSMACAVCNFCMHVMA